MSILVEGTLLSPAGHVIGNADIVLTSISTSLVVLGGTPLSIQTDSYGRYSFTLNNGNYAVSVSNEGNNWFSGMITISDITMPKSINALLLNDAMMAEIPVDYWSYFQAQTGILFENFKNIDDAVALTSHAKNETVNAKDITLSAMQDAKIYSELAQSGSDAYADVQAAQKAINDGVEKRQFFIVKGTDNSWSERYENVSGVATATGDIVYSSIGIDSISNSQARLFETGGGVSYSIGKTGVWDNTITSGWAVGFVPRDHLVNFIELWTTPLLGISYFEVRIYQRSVDLVTTMPGDVKDTLLWAGSISAEMVGQKSKYVTEYQLSRFEFPALTVSSRSTVMITLQPFNTRNEAVYMSVGRCDVGDISGLTGSQIGFWRDTSLGEWKIAGNDSNLHRVAIRAGYKIDTPEKFVADSVDFYDINPSHEVIPNDSTFYGDAAGGNSDFFGWQIAFTDYVGKASAFSMVHTNLLLNEKIRYFVTLRPKALRSLARQLRKDPADINIYSGELDVRDIAINNGPTNVVYRFPEVIIPDGYFIGIEVIAVAEGDVNGHMGIGCHLYASESEMPIDPIAIGFFVRQNNWPGWSTIARVNKRAIAASIGTDLRVPTRAKVYSLDGKVDALETEFAVLPDLLEVETIKSFERQSNSSQWSYTSIPDDKTFFAWSVPVPDATGVLKSVSMVLDGIARNTHVKVTLWTRLRADLELVDIPLSRPGDKTFYSATVAANTLASDNAYHTIVMPVPEFQIPDDSYVLIQAESLVNASNGFLGTGSNTYATGALPPIYLRGWYRRRSFNGETWRTIAGGGAVAVSADFEVIETVKNLTLQLQQEVTDIQTGFLATFIDRYNPMLTVEGTTLNFAGSTATVDGVQKPFAGTLQFSLDQSTGGTETKSGYALKNTGSGTQWPSNPNAWLGRKWISGVSVVRVSDGVLLAPGADYNIDGYGGKLRGLKSVADFLVNATYDFKLERYDLIQIDPTSLVLSVVKGTERNFDVQEYMPVADAGKVPLYYALVAGNSVDLEPVYRYLDLACEMFSNTDALTLQLHNKRVLQKTFGKLAQKLPIKLVGHGDSITAVANISNPETTPNGVTRDIQRFLQGGYGQDTLDTKYPGQDWADGGGAIHVKIGWNWRLKEHIESKYGVTVNYLNYGMSGTNSTSGASANRMNAIMSNNPDLMVLCFGMNDNGEATLYANMRAIIERAVSGGCEVVVMPIPRTPIHEDGRYSLETWRYMNRQIYRAAIDSGAAYVPANWLTEEYGRGGIGLALTSLCGADLRNHPGGREMEVYGKALINLFA